MNKPIHTILILILTSFPIHSLHAQDDGGPDGTQYSYEQTWELLEPACNSQGIDPPKCRCLLNKMIEAHGIDAAAYVALSIWTRDDEANAVVTRIGETRAMGASEVFDFEQSNACANAVNNQEATGAASATGTAIEAASEND